MVKKELIYMVVCVLMAINVIGFQDFHISAPIFNSFYLNGSSDNTTSFYNEVRILDVNDNYGSITRDALGSSFSLNNQVAGSNFPYAYYSTTVGTKCLDTNINVSLGETNFTIMAWQKGTTQNYGITQADNVGVYSSSFILPYSADQFWFNGLSIPSGVDFDDGDWHSWAVMYNDTSRTADIYVDGAYVTTSGAINFLSSASDIYIGCNGIGASPSSMNWDEIVIWESIRSGNDYLDYHNSGVGLYLDPLNNFSTDNSSISSNLLALYHVDEGAGIIAEDSSGNGYEGNLQGGSSWGTGLIISPSDYTLITIINSYDPDSHESSINTFGDLNGRTIIQGDNIRFNTDGSESMRILNNTFVGIGTSNPSSVLHINAPEINNDKEDILYLTVNDAPNSYIKLGSSSSINGAFLPMIVGENGDDERYGLKFSGRVDDATYDGDYYPALIFEGIDKDDDSYLNNVPVVSFTSEHLAVLTSWYDGMLKIGGYEEIDVSGGGVFKPSSMLDVISKNNDNLMNLSNGNNSMFFVGPNGSTNIGYYSNSDVILNLFSENPRLRLSDNKDGIWNESFNFSGIEFYTSESYGSGPHVGAMILGQHTRGGGDHNAGDIGLTFWTSGADSTDPYITPMERMTIEDTGNIAIGTTRATQRLFISGGTNPQIAIQESSTEFVKIGVEATSGDMVLGWDDSDDMHIGLLTSVDDTLVDEALIIKSSRDLEIYDGCLAVGDAGYSCSGDGYIYAENGIDAGTTLTGGTIVSDSYMQLVTLLIEKSSDKTIVDNLIPGNLPNLNLFPTSSTTWVDCQDGDGCTLTLNEGAGWTDDAVLEIYNIGANALTITDTAGVSEMAGNFVMGQYDSITFKYIIDRWIENGRSNN